jgi:hypothetical protein
MKKKKKAELQINQQAELVNNHHADARKTKHWKGEQMQQAAATNHCQLHSGLRQFPAQMSKAWEKKENAETAAKEDANLVMNTRTQST